ncbi:MAG: NUDIX hydrolase [Trueperaceae bacterium]|nr:NUDIX hydrolase [Trueperaceae bacterium]
MARREFVVAAAILLDAQGRVLLVGNDWQGHGHVRYTLPGGVVERFESTLDALSREVVEETGLYITRIEHLAYAVHVEDRRRNDRAISFAFVAAYEGLLNPRDPDGFIVEAKFVPVEEIERTIPIPPLREPLAAYLRDRTPGRFYSYAGWDGRGMRVVGGNQLVFDAAAATPDADGQL